MKIFNLTPITVNSYLLNAGHLAESHTNVGYESGFSFTGTMIDSLKTMIITFNILYTVGGKIEVTQFHLPITKIIIKLMLNVRMAMTYLFLTTALACSILNARALMPMYCQ